MSSPLLVKKISFLFLLISWSLLSTSLSGRQLKPENNNLSKDLDTTLEDEEIVIVHKRLLKANTNDYGTYDPTPALVKPPFKLIPN